MARVVQKSVRGVPYLQVVEDYKDATGIWKQKVLKSFGPAHDPQNYLEAAGYAAAVNAFKERAPTQGSKHWEPWEKAAVAVIGGVALGWLIAQAVTKRR